MKRATFKQALQLSALLVAFALLPGPVEAIARSDVFFAIVFYALLSSVAAFVVWAWPVKR
jgi:hypothetical protein